MDFNLENIYKLIVEQAGVGIGCTDIKTNVMYLNPALTNMLGFETPDEAYGKPVLKFYDPITVSKLENTILTAVMDKGYWVGDLPLISKNGEAHNTLNYLFALKDDCRKTFSFGNIVIPKV